MFVKLLVLTSILTKIKFVLNVTLIVRGVKGNPFHALIAIKDYFWSLPNVLRSVLKVWNNPMGFVVLWVVRLALIHYHASLVRQVIIWMKSIALSVRTFVSPV